MEVNIHEAKTQLSRLLKRVSAGEEVTISRAGVPLAKLVAIGPASGSRPMGMDQDKIWIAEDFDVMDPELEASFFAAIPDVNFPRKHDPKSTPPLSLRKRQKKKA